MVVDSLQDADYNEEGQPIMRHIILAELQKELNDKKIPEFCAELKRRNGYDADARKWRINPEEQKLIDESRKSNGIGNPPKT